MILEGTTSTGAVVPVQVTNDGKVVAEGRTGPEGPQGPEGPEGPEGPQGPAGSPGNLWSGSDPGPIHYSGGSVGIGTTSPGSYDSSANNFVINSAGNTGLTIAAEPAGWSSIYFADGTSGTEKNRGYVDYGHSVDALRFGAAGVERARIDSSGRLLVGTSSTSRTTRISVTGSSAGDSNEQGVVDFQFSGTAPGNGWALGHLNFADTSTGNAARIAAERDGGTWVSGSSMPGRLVFSTSADGDSAPTVRMTIDSQGDVIFQGAPIIKSPNGTHWAIEVDDSGNLSAIQTI